MGDQEIMRGQNHGANEKTLRVLQKKEYPERKTKILKLKKKRMVAEESMTATVKNQMIEIEGEMRDPRGVINMTDRDQAQDLEGKRGQFLLETEGIEGRRTTLFCQYV